jgi:hypothetical protein
MVTLKEALDIVQLQNNYDIAPSSIHGNGVKAKKAFYKGELINKALFPLNGTLQTTEFGGYLNHSIRPNGITRKIGDCYYTFAFKDIKSGDEITVDYTVNKNLEQPKDGWK